MSQLVLEMTPAPATEATGPGATLAALEAELEELLTAIRASDDGPALEQMELNLKARLDEHQAALNEKGGNQDDRENSNTIRAMAVSQD